ncbi:MAG TPA: Lpg1974 family pore-forming outer membrane protein [Chlamydiales bacterium]|nr:Lpg1974 family pore-forming outer membrane protein [Chlamydiales bacterium]
MQSRWFFALILLFADRSFAVQQTTENRIEALERQMQSRNYVKPDFQCKKHSGYVTADYLFLHATEDGLYYATQVKNNPSEAGDIKNIDFEWDSGFRVGLGYRMPHDKWEVFANWTHFVTDASGSLANTTDLVFPEWNTVLFSLPGDLISSIGASWKLHLNTLDGEMARYYRVTRTVSMRPHFGLRGAWIDQSYKTFSNGGDNGTPVTHDDIQMSCDFTGVGLRAGLDTEWTFWNHWSLFGNAGCSLLYGTFEVKQKEILTQTVTPTTQYDISDEYQQNVATADLTLGIRWDYQFCANKGAVRLQAGWEFSDYFGQNKFKHFFAGANESTFSFLPNHEDLTTQGLVVSGRFDY